MRVVTTLLFLLAFNACSSSKVISFYIVDAANISANSFAFYARDTKELRPLQKSLDSLIEVAISQELLHKGYTLKSDADIFVSYQINLGTSSTTNVNNPNYNRYRNNSMYYPNYNVTTTNFKEGVLLLEFWNNNDKLLWQGSKSFKVRKSVDTRTLIIDYATEITAAFKPHL